MKNKDFNKLVFALVASSMVLSGCGNAGFSKKSIEKEKVALIAKAPEFKVKETKYQLDETTEVLIDKIFKKEDIKKIVKHGDHWHIWTKDNVEHITYTNPDEMEDEAEIEAVNVVSADSLSEKSDEVVKILQHGDHYHIYTASGKEYISYENPKANYPKAYFGQYEGEHGHETSVAHDEELPLGNAIEPQDLRKKIKNLEIITVFGEEKVDRFDIVKILKHGDHYHIFDSKGREGIVYFNPASLYPNAKFGNYIGEHGEKKDKVEKNKKESNKEANNSKKKTEEKLIDANKVVKILQHGDHYHLYTAGGEEFISYEDIREKYPDAEFGQYVGDHKDEKKQKNEKRKEVKKKTKKDKKEKKEDNKKKDSISDTKKEIENLNIITLLGGKPINRYDIVKVLQHGDHYHIFDSEGNEGIVYINPKELYPNAEFGQYVGNHGEKKEVEEEKIKKEGQGAGGGSTAKDDTDGSRVVTILVHGDHYHVYTADGTEYITYSDPSAQYPDATFGVYTGTHDDLGGSGKEKENTNSQKTDSSSLNSSTNYGENFEGREAPIRTLSITGVLGQKPLNRFDIVRILQHGDHYHVFDSENNEGITRTNPKHLFPKATFGQYEGSHGEGKNHTVPIVWPEGITKIVDHGDHWHLWKDGTEVSVVNVDPKGRYPKAEYIVEKVNENSDIKVEGSDLFTYESVVPKMSEGIGLKLDDNLKSMTHFGTIPSDGIRSFGANGETSNVFYWLHNNDHYHAITIKQIIQNAKAGKYGNYTAKEVVAALKAKIEKGEPFETEIVDNDKNEAIHKYLMKGFRVAKNDVEILKNQILVYFNGKRLEFHSSDFKEVDGFIRFKTTVEDFEENNVQVIRYGRGRINHHPQPDSEKVKVGDTGANTDSSKDENSGSSQDNGNTEEINEGNSSIGTNDSDSASDSTTGEDSNPQGMAELSKEEKNFKKLAEIFKSTEDNAFELIDDFMRLQNIKKYSVVDLEIDVPRRTITFKGKEYQIPEDFGA